MYIEAITNRICSSQGFIDIFYERLHTHSINNILQLHSTLLKTHKEKKSFYARLTPVLVATD